MKDVQIIGECASRNWVIVSGDKSIERVPEERQAVINGKCKVFMFDDSHKTRTEDWIAAFLVGRERILEIVAKTKGPMFVTIKPSRARGHISAPRFVGKAGGGWLAENEPAPVATVSAAPRNVEHTPTQQRELFKEPVGVASDRE
jgi:PIN domain-containing protein